jgi:hypothetical protein
VADILSEERLSGERFTGAVWAHDAYYVPNLLPLPVLRATMVAASCDGFCSSTGAATFFSEALFSGKCRSNPAVQDAAG